MTKVVLDSDRSARSSRCVSLCLRRWQRLKRQPSYNWGGATPHPAVHPQPLNHTPVGAENSVRYLHSLQAYNHTPVGAENSVRYLHSLQAYNYTPVGAGNSVRYLHSLQGYNHSPRKDRPTSRAYLTALYVQLTGYTSFNPWPLTQKNLQILAAKRDLELPRRLKQLGRFDALIIDDIGYVQQDRDEMEVLFNLLSHRYERGSVMITSNLPFSQWEQIFKDPMTTVAAIDRLIHHSVVLELNVPSYRLEASKKKNRTS